MKKTFVCFLFILIAGCMGIFAQQGMTKFGVIDTARVYTVYFRNSSGVREYESKKTEFQAEVNKRTEELQALKQKKVEYDRAGKSMDALKTEGIITEKSDFLIEYTRVKQQELDSLKNKLKSSDEFYNTLYNVIEQIAEAEGYSMILSLQQANAILWYSPAVDITDQVISRLSNL